VHVTAPDGGEHDVAAPDLCTALAEAELEYAPETSPSIHVRFAATPESLAQLTFEPAQIARELGGQIEVAVIDGPNLDAEPAAGHGALRCAEPGHAVGQRASVVPGKPRNLA